ncbi:unnamed protein product [Rotaria sp. Silwood1]|nr:unnamed protein product [Rotaria sp. Silwood1]CAF0745368.1 unnamed protein product [Rotaria sp. Silwood1]CAF3351445.1 unnamed protein product [Rotaria sp. Silwood1]CAF3355613.1 unnamed protein product [Rotaria sp. Silwood1]CAF3356119.1 unnamed protein product [Rotaria sp. Silwood1]
MNNYFTFPIILISFLLITLISGRAIYYDELNDDDNTKPTSSDEEDYKSKLLNIVNDDDNDINDNDISFDSNEEKKFHQRQIVTRSEESNTVSPHTREAIMDLLQKAFDQGWRPNLKHYIPATRFGRH